MKFRYSSNGDGSYTCFYGSDVVAWCADKASAKHICNVANSAQQSTHLTGRESAALQSLSTPEVLSFFDRFLHGVNVAEEYIPAHLVVGSMPPSGYIAWHEWAEAQGKGGLKQSQCGECGLWFFPQEAINHMPNKACARRAKVGAQKISSKLKRSVKSARGPFGGL